VGLLTSFIIQIIIYPLLNIEVSIKQNIIITVIFVTVSIIRGYIIRRIFNQSKPLPTEPKPNNNKWIEEQYYKMEPQNEEYGDDEYDY
jgi:hypothetical protein